MATPTAPPTAGVAAGAKLQGRCRGLCAVVILLVLLAAKATLRPQAPAPGLAHHRELQDASTASGGECVIPNGTNWSQKCRVAKANCTSDDFDSHVFASNYLQLYYCTLGHGSDVLASTLILFLLVLCFMLLGSTAEDYFCPALASLSELLSLQPRVAGVTLLALGNGAPDVFSIISSVKKGKAQMAVGEVTGAGNFVTTAVVGSVCIVTADGLKARGMFLRDVCMLMVSTAMLLAIFIDGEVTQGESICFLVLYTVYVSMVVIGSKVPPLLKTERGKWREDRAGMSQKPAAVSMTVASDTLGDDLLKAEGGETAGTIYEQDVQAQDIQAQEEADKLQEEETAAERDSHSYMLPKLGEISTKNASFSRSSVTPTSVLKQQAGDILSAHAQTANDSDKPMLRHSWATASVGGAGNLSAVGTGFGERPKRLQRSRSLQKRGWLKYRIKNKFDLAHEWSEKNAFEKLLWAVESPFTLGRCLTIPVVVEEIGSLDWNEGFQRMFMVLNPSCALAFVVFFFTEGDGDMLGVPKPLLGFIAGLLLTPLVYRLTVVTPPSVLVNLYVVVAFLSALFWINIIADELVSILTTIGVIYKLPPDLLGLTVLAMGNSLGDMAANLAVARGGYPNMAVTACYAGPFFNMCIGVGVSFFTATMATSDKKIKYVETSDGKCTATSHCDMRLPTTLFISSSWIILVMIGTLATAVVFHFHLPRKWGFGALGSYGVYFAVIIVQYFCVPPKDVYFDRWS